MSIMGSRASDVFLDDKWSTSCNPPCSFEDISPHENSLDILRSPQHADDDHWQWNQPISGETKVDLHADERHIGAWAFGSPQQHRTSDAGNVLGLKEDGLDTHETSRLAVSILKSIPEGRQSSVDEWLEQSHGAALTATSRNAASRSEDNHERLAGIQHVFAAIDGVMVEAVLTRCGESPSAGQP
jgi:hypothetical protein